MIRGKIRSTTDQSDNELFAKFEVLRRPMLLAPMPSLARIAEMSDAKVIKGTIYGFVLRDDVRPPRLTDAIEHAVLFGI